MKTVWTTEQHIIHAETLADKQQALEGDFRARSGFSNKSIKATGINQASTSRFVSDCDMSQKMSALPLQSTSPELIRSRTSLTSPHKRCPAQPFRAVPSRVPHRAAINTDTV